MGIDNFIKRYEKEMRKSPNNPIVCYNLACAYKNNERLEDAIEMYNKAIAFAHNIAKPKRKEILAEAYTSLARIHKEQGEQNKATEEQEKAKTYITDPGPSPIL